MTVQLAGPTNGMRSVDKQSQQPARGLDDDHDRLLDHLIGDREPGWYIGVDVAPTTPREELDELVRVLGLPVKLQAGRARSSPRRPQSLPCDVPPCQHQRGRGEPVLERIVSVASVAVSCGGASGLASRRVIADIVASTVRLMSWWMAVRSVKDKAAMSLSS